MAKGHRKPNAERGGDTDVFVDHRESCVEKAQASGEPCARKRASTVWEGAAGQRAALRIPPGEIQAGRSIHRYLAGRLLHPLLGRPYPPPRTSTCSLSLHTALHFPCFLAFLVSGQLQHTPLSRSRVISGSARPLPPKQNWFRQWSHGLSLLSGPHQRSAQTITVVQWERGGGQRGNDVCSDLPAMIQMVSEARPCDPPPLSERDGPLSWHHRSPEICAFSAPLLRKIS